MLNRRYGETNTNMLSIKKTATIMMLALALTAAHLSIATTLGFAQNTTNNTADTADTAANETIIEGSSTLGEQQLNRADGIRAVHLSTALSYANIVHLKIENSNQLNKTLYAKIEAQTDGSTPLDNAPLIGIVQFDIALKVENLKPVGVGNRFSVAKGKQTIKLYAFTDIQTAIYPTSILHVWVYNGRVAAEIPLEVASANWRTYSSKIIEKNEQGNWSVYIYHIKDGGVGGNKAGGGTNNDKQTNTNANRGNDATNSLFRYYEAALANKGGQQQQQKQGGKRENGILSQEVSVVTNPTQPATLLGVYSFVME